ncbi:MAG: MFS transporter [Bacteroidales bacterium]|nr:MFS transporter [Bacteroidales bacterium]
MKKTFIPVRFVLVFTTFLLTLLLYIDRVCISAAKGEISADLSLTDKQMGWILSAFAIGYAFFQVPGGLLGDKFGPRRVLTSIVTIWSIFTALTGVAWNYASMFITRTLFGAGEAGAFPCISRSVFSWFPLKERGFVTGINFSGSRIGAAFALPVVAIMINNYGWRNTFYIWGAVGVIWAVVWYFFFRDEPDQHPFIGDKEKNYILENRQQKNSDKKEKISTSSVLGSANMWLAMGQYFASNFIFFFCLTWLFPYLKEKYDLSATATGLYASLPFYMGFAGNIISGILVDSIFRRGKWNISRRLPAIIGFSLTAIGLLMLVRMDTPLGAVLWLSVAIFGADMTLSPSWSFCTDIGKQYAGAVSGTMNMAGNIGSIITALAFPYLKAWTGSETPFFYVAAFLALLAIIMWLFMNPQKSLITEDK